MPGPGARSVSHLLEGVQAAAGSLGGMNRSCFHANRGYLTGVTVIVLCLLAVLHPGTKARLTFSKEVRPSFDQPMHC